MHPDIIRLTKVHELNWTIWPNSMKSPGLIGPGDVRIGRVLRMSWRGIGGALLLTAAPTWAAEGEFSDDAVAREEPARGEAADAGVAADEPLSAEEPPSVENSPSGEVTAGAADPRAPAGSSFRLHGVLAGAKAVSGHQSREYGFGGAAIGAIEWSPDPIWGIQAELGWIGLGGVDREPPAGLGELSGATGGHLAIGLRGRPFAKAEMWNSSGPWASAALGIELTGGVVAPMLDVFFGYDLPVTEKFSLGPTVGYALVLQTQEDSPRPDNANILLAGLHGTFDFGSQATQPRELDRDHDGILDERDQCPDDPEDKDGFEDADGCPDLDNDQDNILDLVDRCPLDPEDRDEFEDEDGCPDPDNDLDTIPDVSDKCPLEPEDIDEFEDEDGCPDLDNDKDNIPDIKDLCPNEPEIVNGIADNDGCPDSESVRVVGDKIELDQKIHFWTNSDRIRGMSYPVLDKLAKFLIEHPEYVHVDIEGHADRRGDQEFNLDLSKRRAASIREFLKEHGLEEARLSSEGFGSTRPLVDADNERAWFMNRRVEFVVTRNRTVKVNADTGELSGEQPPVAPVFGRDKEDVAGELEDVEEGEEP